VEVFELAAGMIAGAEEEAVLAAGCGAAGALLASD
jgi:hypothetical protein